MHWILWEGSHALDSLGRNGVHWILWEESHALDSLGRNDSDG